MAEPMLQTITLYIVVI